MFTLPLPPSLNVTPHVILIIKLPIYPFCWNIISSYTFCENKKELCKRGLKQPARGPHVVRQMHLWGPRTPQKMPRELYLIKLSLFWGLFLYIAARKSVFLINCVPRSILFLECGPPTNLSLRPLLYNDYSSYVQNGDILALFSCS
jgi:hypothetical protein